ncbi:MAG: hypothetical protein JWM11_7636 [Planctomycetaceae bacterium]|nr:hypothetical protein [Planctomycetaceae bacterium]
MVVGRNVWSVDHLRGWPVSLRSGSSGDAGRVALDGNRRPMNIPDQDSSPTPPGIDLSAPAEIAAVVFVPPPPPRRQPTSLARRISSRTTDLLAIAIVLVGSLALGRQVLEWWRAVAPPILDGGPLAGLETDMGGDGQPVELEFADSPFRLIRQTLSRSGPLEALGLVQEVCQKALLAAQPLELPPDQAERDMLHAIEGRQP